jgi:predicted RNase H-like HicB family nuclease
MLRVIIYQDNGDWIAHCLEMDLVADGETPMKAIQQLRTTIDFQISSVLLTGNLESLFSRAPSDIYALFESSIPYLPIVIPTKYIGSFYVRITSGD